MHSCPLLKASFYECLRLDTSPVLLRKVQKDFTIIEPRSAMFGDEQPPAYLLRPGEFVAIPLVLHHQDPSVFDSPQVFRPERFHVPSEKGEGREVADLDVVMPWDGNDGTGLGIDVVEREVLAFVAGILALWDFEPAKSGRWVTPVHRTSPNFMEPKSDVRVRVRRRALG